MDPERYRIFSLDFMLLLLFISLGVTSYWLIFKRIVSFK
jgi:hypothetical protein